MIRVWEPRQLQAHPDVPNDNHTEEGEGPGSSVILPSSLGNWQQASFRVNNEKKGKFYNYTQKSYKSWLRMPLTTTPVAFDQAEMGDRPGFPHDTLQSHTLLSPCDLNLMSQSVNNARRVQSVRASPGKWQLRFSAAMRPENAAETEGVAKCTVPC